MTRDEARDMLGPSGGTEVLQSNLANHEHMKKKGGLGVAPLVLEAHGLVDIVNIPLPSREGARKAQTSWIGEKAGYVRSLRTFDYSFIPSRIQVTSLHTALEMGYPASPLK